MVDARLRLQQVRFRGREAEELGGHLRLDGGHYSVRPIAVRTAGAVFRGDLESTGEGARRGTRLQGTLAADDTKGILAALGFTDVLSGTLEAELDVVIPARAPWRSSGRGRFSVELTEGRLHTVQVLAEILSPLVPRPVSGVLGPFKRITEIEALGTGFDRMRFEGELRKGELQLKGITVQAFGLTVLLAGTMDLATGHLELAGTSRIEPSLLERVGLERLRGSSILSIPITIRGPIRRPRVLPDLEKLMRLAGSVDLRSIPGRMLGEGIGRLRSLADRSRPAEDAPPARARKKTRSKKSAKKKTTGGTGGRERPAAKKKTARKKATKKTAPGRSSPRKATGKKAPEKKPAARKTAAKKTAAKKTGTRKAATRRTAGGRKKTGTRKSTSRGRSR